MTTHDEKPPQRGITRTPTPYPFGPPLNGWYLTPEGMADAERHVDQRRGGDATTETAPHLSRRAVHPETAPTTASRKRAA